MGSMQYFDTVANFSSSLVNSKNILLEVFIVSKYRLQNSGRIRIEFNGIAGKRSRRSSFPAKQEGVQADFCR